MWGRKVLIEYSPHQELQLVEFLCYSVSGEGGFSGGLTAPFLLKCF